MRTEQNVSGSEKVSVIRRFDGSWNDHKFDEIMSYFAEEATVQLTPPPPAGGVYRGKKKVEKFVRSLLPGFHVNSTYLLPEGCMVKWLFTVSPTISKAWASIP